MKVLSLFVLKLKLTYNFTIDDIKSLAAGVI